MSEEKPEKIVIFVMHGPEDAERASQPFVFANAALALNVQAVVILQGAGVMLAKKGCYEHVFAAGMSPLRELVDSFIELGGVLLVCLPCIQERQITEDMLVETAKPIKSARAIMEILDATATLNY